MNTRGMQSSLGVNPVVSGGGMVALISVWGVPPGPV